MKVLRIIEVIVFALAPIILTVPRAAAQSCRWDGTSPFCSGECGPGETEELRLASPPGIALLTGNGAAFGNSCATGTKALCCKTPGRTCHWDGTAPFCSGSCKNGETQASPPPGSSSGKGCWTGQKVYCCSTTSANVGRFTQPLTTDGGIDQNTYYKLSTQFRGAGWKLDVINGGPKNNLTQLAPDQNVSGQFWRVTVNPDGTVRLTTLFRGQNMCLDIFNGGAQNNQPHLTNCGNFSGQSWRLIQNVDGTFRLATLFRGPGMCLDIFNGGTNNNQPYLANCANFSGQIWTLTKTSKRVGD